MVVKVRTVLTLSASLHTIGTAIVTIGLLRQFDIRVFEFLFNTPLEIQVSGGLITIGILFTISAFWIQFIFPKVRKLFR